MNRLVLLAALVTAAIVLVVPATASADALVWHTDCAFFVAGKEYRGSGTEVITANGQGILQCHLSLASGSAVDRPTTTTIGSCELQEVPSGEARASCRFQV
jgi:hypothetical protein